MCRLPLTTVGGVVLAVVRCVLRSTLIMGMFANKELSASGAPFAGTYRVQCLRP